MGDCDVIKLPLQYALYATEDRLATTSNLTPRHAIVELHIDRGFHGLTVLRGGCVKFWMFYPATDRNMSLWDQYCGKPYPFLSLLGQLEGPVFEIQKHGEAIHFGPCFHITYTVEGGITSGVNYMRAESFQITYRILEIEQNHNRLKSNDFKALLECVSLCLRDNESRYYKEALGACCKYSKQFKILSKPTFNSLIEHLQVTEKDKCPKCRKVWKAHGSNGTERKRAH